MSVEGNLDGDVSEAGSPAIRRIPANESDLGILIEIGLSPSHIGVYTGLELEENILRLGHAVDAGLIVLVDSGTYCEERCHYHTYGITSKGSMYLSEFMIFYDQLVAAEKSVEPRKPD